ncbi:MAG: transglutaminase domain-containing protein [Phycisphaerales bacterium JB038]
MTPPLPSGRFRTNQLTRRARGLGMVALLVLLLGAAVCGARAEEGDGGDCWAEFVRVAAVKHGDAGREAAEFLRAHRPKRDRDLPLELLVENLDYALRARSEFPWAAAVPQDLFHNDVLPYAVFDETREAWRASLYEIAKEIVADCTTATEAAQALNQHLFNTVNVHYNTGRKKPNQSPAESMAQGRATCTGLSILLIDACRAVGVPARGAGVASWYGKSGNHTWVEVWDGQWYFTGADEYNAGGLDRAWFVGDASKAKGDMPLHAVWATSWAPNGGPFPMAWNLEAKYVGGVNVTHRYAAQREDAEGRALWHFRLWDQIGGERMVATVRLLDPDREVVAEVMTKAGQADLNDMPAVALVPGVPYRLEVEYDGQVRFAGFPAGTAGEETADLPWDELGLDEATAEALVESMYREVAARIAKEREAELAEKEVKFGDHSMRLLERTFGDAPEGERSLWISMHGGGGAPAQVNDQQWRNQIRLYEPAEGIYLAPRAPTNTWNLWHQAHIDPLFDRLIETYVAARGVDPDRVYLLGYSAGGDGVYQLAPRMADRLAAASMMAGHPNEASPLGLRNLPFFLFMGGKDGAYNRNQVAREWGAKLAALQTEDPEGYPHRLTIYEDKGHWMGGKDREVLPWMAAETRDPWPKRIVWRQDDVTHTRFYWLGMAEEDAKPGVTVIAEVEGQTIRIETEDVQRLTLRLRDELIDLDEMIHIEVNGENILNIALRRTASAIAESLAERADPRTAATELLKISW